MVRRINFRAFPPALAGEGDVTNERRFRALVEQSFSLTDTNIGLLQSALAASTLTYREKMESPTDVTEAGGVTDLVTLNITSAVGGVYRYTLNLLATYAQTNDALIWRLVGDAATSDDFAFASQIPLTYSDEVTLVSGEDYTLTIEAEVSGPGQAVVTVSQAGIFFQRIE